MADDGSAELVVGPGAVGVNAIDTTDRGSSLAIRQFLYDWDTEVPHRLTIERVAGPPRDEVRQVEFARERVRRLARFMATSSVTQHRFVGDHWFQSLGYKYRPTSLNGFQAHLDHGRFFTVIAHDDPGIANWFDTCANRELPVTYRWQLPRVPRDELPTPSLRVVTRAVLDDEVPTWARRVTPAERQASLDVRRRAVLRRFGRG